MFDTLKRFIILQFSLSKWNCLLVTETADVRARCKQLLILFVRFNMQIVFFCVFVQCLKANQLTKLTIDKLLISMNLGFFGYRFSDGFPVAGPRVCQRR